MILSRNLRVSQHLKWDLLDLLYLTLLHYAHLYLSEIDCVCRLEIVSLD